MTTKDNKVSSGRGKHAAPELSAPIEAGYRRKLAIALAALLALVLVVAAAFFLLGGAKLLPDANAREGSLKAVSQAIEPNDYRLVLNQKPVVEQGSSSCNIEFEVPRESTYSSRFEVKLDATDELLASSGMVLPGNNIEMVELSQALEPGEHTALVVVDVYRGLGKANTITAEITIRVK